MGRKLAVSARMVPKAISIMSLSPRPASTNAWRTIGRLAAMFLTGVPGNILDTNSGVIARSGEGAGDAVSLQALALLKGDDASFCSGPEVPVDAVRIETEIF